MTFFYTSIAHGQDNKRREWQDLVNLFIANSDMKFVKDPKFEFHILAAKIQVTKTAKNKLQNEITFNDSIGYAIFPRIDSVIANRDLSVFLNGNHSGTIILPIEVDYRDFNIDPKEFKVSWLDLFTKLNSAFFYKKDDVSFYDYIFLPPLIVNMSRGY